ncbi:MAG: DUF4139 domain-containing protein [Anaerolineae bacterium]
MQTIETTIVAVTVYTDRARVTRRGRVDLPPGQHTLVIPNLPRALDQDSVRASGRGAAARILGLDVRSEQLVEVPEEQIAALERDLQDLREQDKALHDEDDVLAARLADLKNLASSSAEAFARGLAWGRLSSEQVTALADYVESGTLSLLERRRQIARQRADLAKQIEALEHQLKELQRKRDRFRRSIHVDVEVDAAGEFDLSVDYLIGDASWQPQYDIRLADGEITLSYLASVTQRTGEDWPEVALLLSTARPAISGTLPEPAPWFIDVYQPPRPQPRPVGSMAAAPVPMGAARAQLKEAAGAEADERLQMAALSAPSVPIAEAFIESGEGGALTYRVERPVAVPSDGSPHRTTVTVQKLGVELDYLCVPRIALEAYLRATITNTSPFTLLPGPASIFHGSDFVGKTHLELIAPNEEFEVQLGVDDRIRVQRELARRDVSKSLIGGIRRSEFGYRITLTSLLDAPARLVLFDQFPISRHESIKVKLLSASPAPDEQDDLNIMQWKLMLNPREKQVITFNFSVEHPRTLHVVGLNI